MRQQFTADVRHVGPRQWMVVVTNWDVNKALVVLRTGRVLRAYKIALDLARSQNGMGELWCNLADQEHSALRREAV